MAITIYMHTYIFRSMATTICFFCMHTQLLHTVAVKAKAAGQRHACTTTMQDYAQQILS